MARSATPDSHEPDSSDPDLQPEISAAQQRSFGSTSQLDGIRALIASVADAPSRLSLGAIDGSQTQGMRAALATVGERFGGNLKFPASVVGTSIASSIAASINWDGLNSSVGLSDFSTHSIVGGQINGEISGLARAVGALSITKDWASTSALTESLRTASHLSDSFVGSVIPSLNLSNSSIAAALSSGLGPSASMLSSIFDGLPTSSLASFAGSSITGRLVPRIEEISLGFAKASGSNADAYGRMSDVIDLDRGLSVRVDQALRATQQRGSFGFPYASTADAVQEVADYLEVRPELESQLEQPLEDLREVTLIDDELLFDYSSALGWRDRIAGHRPSGTALILAFSLGLCRAITADPIGNLPGAIADAMTVGAGVYIYIHDKKRMNDRPQ